MNDTEAGMMRKDGERFRRNNIKDMIIGLTGFMGSGKSSVGRRLSELLCCRFMDLDKVIESREGRSIPEIFASEGEAGFRRIEHEALNMVINSSSTDGDLVLALGGGTVMTTACAKLIHEHTFCIYLRASAETLASRLQDEAAGRPLLQSPDNSDKTGHETLHNRISGLMKLRAATYESVAHSVIDTDSKSIDEIAAGIATEITTGSTEITTEITTAKFINPNPEAGSKSLI